MRSLDSNATARVGGGVAPSVAGAVFGCIGGAAAGVATHGSSGRTTAGSTAIAALAGCLSGAAGSVPGLGSTAVGIAAIGNQIATNVANGSHQKKSGTANPDTSEPGDLYVARRWD